MLYAKSRHSLATRPPALDAPLTPGKLDGNVARLGAFQDLVDEGGCAAEHVGNVRTVGDESTSYHELPGTRCDRQPVRAGEFAYAVHIARQDEVIKQEEPVHPFLQRS